MRYGCIILLPSYRLCTDRKGGFVSHRLAENDPNNRRTATYAWQICPLIMLASMHPSMRRIQCYCSLQTRPYLHAKRRYT